MEAYDKERSRAVRRRIRSVLMEQWDPIGVKNAPEAGDEYDGYIGSIFDLINRNATVLEIEEYLRWAEQRNMELGFSEDRKMLRLTVAASLKDLIRS
jgi:hypothetical protein